MITHTDPIEPAPESPAHFTLRRQAACADELVVRAFALPAVRAPRGASTSVVPVQFTETAFTPRIVRASVQP